MKNISILKRSLIYVIILITSLILIESPLIPDYLEIFISAFICIMLIVILIIRELLVWKLSVQNFDQKQYIEKISEYSTDVIICKDKDYKVFFHNPSLLKILGLNENVSLVGKYDHEFFRKETAEITKKYDKQVMETTLPVRYMLQSENKIPYEAVSSPILQNGEVTGLVTIFRNISQQETYRIALETKKQELETILGNIPVVAILKNIDGSYIYCNNVLWEHCKIKPVNFEDMKNFFFKSDFYKDIKKEDEYILSTKQVLIMCKIMELIKGVPKWYKIVKTPIFDTEGNVEKIGVFIRCIESEKEQEKQKNNFIATLTHDLKNPTFAQIRALELLQKGSFGDVSQEQQDIIAEMLQSCKYMMSMILIIIDSYKYEGGNIVLNISEFNISELINEVCNEMKSLLSERNQQFILEIDNSAYTIWADRLQIKRAITNLVSNAIYYGQKNKVIKIQLETKENEFLFKVVNYGDYIKEDDLKQIFEKYVSKPSIYNTISSGLGLYLTNEIIIAHNGKMTVTSSKEGINTFGFTFDKVINKSNNDSNLKNNTNQENNYMNINDIEQYL